ncbi:MAG: group 1 truncated hemoglobin [Pyrinomonadaceae bacterium]
MLKMKRFALAFCCFSLLVATAAAQDSMSGGQMMKKSLYERLGGEAALKGVVDDVVARAAADTRINAKFGKTDIPRLKFHLVKQLCAVTGGPCKDINRTQEKIHHNLKITSGEFDAFVEDLVATLDKFNVPAPEKTELLGILGSLKSKVVEVADSAATGTPLPADFKPAKPLPPEKMTDEKLMDKKRKGMAKKP